MRRMVTLLTLLLTVFKSEPNPIVCFVRVQQIQPVSLLNGVILTSKYVLTLYEPLKQYGLTNLVIVAGFTDLKNYNYIAIYTYGLSKINPPSNPDLLNLAAVETDRKIEFDGLRLSLVNILPRLVFKQCHVMFNFRTSRIYNYQILKSYQVTTNKVNIVGGNRDPTLLASVRADQKMKICNYDSGLPVFCEFGLIGLLDWPVECLDSKKNCFNECVLVPSGSIFTFKLINIFSKEAEEFIGKYRERDGYS